MCVDNEICRGSIIIKVSKTISSGTGALKGAPDDHCDELLKNYSDFLHLRNLMALSAIKSTRAISQEFEIYVHQQ